MTELHDKIHAAFDTMASMGRDRACEEVTRFTKDGVLKCDSTVEVMARAMCRYYEKEEEIDKVAEIAQMVGSFMLLGYLIGRQERESEILERLCVGE